MHFMHFMTYAVWVSSFGCHAGHSVRTIELYNQAASYRERNRNHPGSLAASNLFGGNMRCQSEEFTSESDYSFTIQYDKIA